MLEKNYQKLFYSNLNKLFFSSVWLVWSIGILFRCVVSLKEKTYSFTLKQVLSNFMIFKGKDFIQYASNKQITFDKLSKPEKKENKIMKAETLFRINLFYLLNLPPKSGTTFYREGWVYYYNLSTVPAQWKSLATGLHWIKARDLDHFRMLNIGDWIIIKMLTSNLRYGQIFNGYVIVYLFFPQLCVLIISYSFLFF